MTKAYLAGPEEFARLWSPGKSKEAVATWRKRGLLTNEQALIVSGSPYWPLGYAVEWADTVRTVQKRPDAAELRAIKQAQGRGVMVSTAAEVEPVAGLQELTALYGLGRNVASAMRAKGGASLPPEDYVVSGKPLWLVETLASAAAERGRTVDEGVLAALRARTYDGPGSVVIARGRAAHTTTEV